MNADSNGVARFVVRARKPGQQSEALTHLLVRCQAEGATSDYPIDLRFHSVPTFDAPAPVPEPPRPGGVTLPALTAEDSVRLTSEELLRRGYPPRPDRNGPAQRLAMWRNAFSTPTRLAAPEAPAGPASTTRSPAVAPGKGSILRSMNTFNNNNWSGYILKGPQGSFDQIDGTWVVPRVEGELYTQTQAATWVGLDGQSSQQRVGQWAGPYGPTNTPAAASNPVTMAVLGQQHVFYRDGNGAIWNVFWDPARGLTADAKPWAGPGAYTVSQPAVGDPATLSADNQQHIFYRDQYGTIIHVFESSSAFSKPEYWATGAGTPGKVGPAANNDPTALYANHEQHIFYIRTGGASPSLDGLWHVFHDPSRGQVAEKWAGGTTPDGSVLVGTPATLYAGDRTGALTGQQHVFYRAGSEIWHTYYDGSSKVITEQWAGPGSSVSPTGAAGAPATLLWGAQQHIFYRGVDGSIRHVFYDPSRGLVGETWQKTGAAGDPTTLVTSTQQHVFYLDTSGNMEQLYYDAGSNKLSGPEVWTGPSSPTGAISAQGDAATMFYNDLQMIFYRGTDNNIWQVLFDPNNNDLVQAGTTQSAINAGDSVDASYSAWAQYVPNDSSDHTLDMTVNAGDQIYAFVYMANPGQEPSINGSQAQFFVKNLTTGDAQHYSEDKGSLFFGGTEAEWIVERPGYVHPFNNGLYDFAAFGFTAIFMGYPYSTDNLSQGNVLQLVNNKGTALDNVALLPFGTPPAASRPALLTTGGQQHTFYTGAGTNDRIWHVLHDPTNGLYTETWSIPGGPSKSSLIGNPVSMLANNQLHIFYRALAPAGPSAGAAQIWHVSDSPSSGIVTDPNPWAGPGASVAAPSPAGDPATMIANGQEHIFYRDVSGNIWHVFSNPTGKPVLDVLAWAGPTSFTGLPPAAGDPATLVTGSQQHVFYRGTDQNIWQVLWYPGLKIPIRDPNPWGGPGSSSDIAPAAGDPAVFVWGSQQHVFYRDDQGNIQHVFYDSSVNRRFPPEQWASGAGSHSTGPAAAGNPATLVAANQQHIFYRDVAGNIWHVYWDQRSNSRTAEPWAGPSSPTSTPTAQGDPAVMEADGQQHLFYLGTDNNIWHVFYDENAHALHHEQWSGPGSITGPGTVYFLWKGFS